MLALVLLLVLCCGWRQCAGHEWSLSCGAGGGGAGAEPLRFTAAEGGGARYDLRWCTNVTEPFLHSWGVYLYVIGEHEYANKCPERLSLMNKEVMHSKFEQIINKTVDCAVVCLSTHLDLVYRGCYQLRLALHAGAAGAVGAAGTAGHSVRAFKRLLFVDNQYTLEDINSHETWFTATSAGDKVVITIYNKFIPLDDYFVQLCNESECWSIRDSCQPLGAGVGGGGAAVRCTAGVGVQEGGAALRADLSHAAPWVHGGVFAPSLLDVTFNFTHGAVSAQAMPEAAGAGAVRAGAAGRWAGAACGAALGGALLLAVWLWWRRQPAARWRENVARAWKERYNTVTSEECVMAAPAPAPALPVLLLYARDAEPLMRAMAALRRLLLLHTGGEVYDLFTPATAAACGGAPAAWLRALLAGGARVVLVQTLPACLYQGSNGGGGSALLPSRVVYRVPQFGDTLLQYALRHLQQHAHAPTAYTRYYVCSVSSLPAEMMSGVVPFRRYELPGALGALLRDLGGPPAPALAPAPAPALEDEFRHALREHVEYVRAHENYLQDDLLRIL